MSNKSVCGTGNSILHSKQFGRRNDGLAYHPNVLHLLECPGSGGIEKMAITLAEAQGPSLSGFLFFRRGQAILQFKRVTDKCFVIEDMVSAHASQVKALNELLRKSDLIHLHTMYLSCTEARFLDLCRRPAVITVHANVIAPLTRHPIVCLSEMIASKQINRHCDVIENGVNCSRFYPEARKNDKVILIRVCRAERSAREFWDVVRPVLLKHPETELWILGEKGADRPQVRFFGFVEETAPIMRKADIFVYCPSPPGGAHDLCVIEAMATGLAIVTTAVPGAGQSIRDGVDGLVREGSDIQGLRVALEQLISSYNLRQRLGLEARKTALSRFSHWRMAVQYRDVYVKALGGGPIVDERV